MAKLALKSWKGKQFSSSAQEDNVDDSGCKQFWVRTLATIWLIAGVGTYLFDVEPLRGWIIAWSVIFLFSLIILTYYSCAKSIWFLRCWRRITCREGCSGSRHDHPEEISKDTNQFDNKKPTTRQLIQTVYRISMPYFRESRGGRWLTFAMSIAVLLNSAVSVLFSYASKNFYDALNEGNAVRFQQVLIKYILILFAYAPIIALYNYQRERLAVHWRDWMTQRTLRLYGNNRAYYILEREGKIDNPDQRIAEDVNSFCSYSLKLLVMTCKNTINLFSFSFILYTIAPRLFYVIVGYVTIGTIVTLCLGRPLVHLNFKLLQTEADFRFSLVRLRENAESIAFYAGEELEMSFINTRFTRAILTRVQIIWKEFQLETFTNIYFYMTWIVPVAIVAPQYFDGSLELGSVTQSREAFHHVLSDISILIREFADITKFSAGISRLAAFYDAIEKTGEGGTFGGIDSLMTQNMKKKISSLRDESSTDASDSESSAGQAELKKDGSIEIVPLTSFQNKSDGGIILGVNRLTVWTPTHKRVLIENLNFSLKRGQNLMIAGSSGTGKSTLLRCIAGLWNGGEGVITRPRMDDIYFLPQRPYCALGSLRDQLLYPSFSLDSGDAVAISVNNTANMTGKNVKSACQSRTDQELLDILCLVKLSKLAYHVGNGDPFKGLNAVEDWSNMLSLGEQQRLGFARVFVNRPNLVIMDEATSALDAATQSHMYGILESMAKASNSNTDGNNVSMIQLDGDSRSIPFKPIMGGMSFVSVGHRSTMLAYHDKKLLIREDGYNFIDIDKEEARNIASEASANLLS